jgi:site-specific DNA-methyltransferase (adenine-specific)
MKRKKTKFIRGDCLNILPRIKNVDLIITDPPYNIGWDYSSEVNDKKKDYHSWCLKWCELCFESLKEDGVLCVVNYPENNNVLYTDLIRRGYNFVQQLIWKYSTNVGQSKKKYTRSHRTILVFSKSKNYFFNPKNNNIKTLMIKGLKKE